MDIDTDGSETDQDIEFDDDNADSASDSASEAAGPRYDHLNPGITFAVVEANQADDHSFQIETSLGSKSDPLHLVSISNSGLAPFACVSHTHMVY